MIEEPVKVKHERDALRARVAELEREKAEDQRIIGGWSKQNQQLRAEVERLREALTDMLRLCESLMPGVRYIALQDYALLNEAPIKARAALAGKEMP